MKKIILASAAILFIGLTAFAAFSKDSNDDADCKMNCEKYFIIPPPIDTTAGC